MSDTIDDYRGMKNHKTRLREKYGMDCPECLRLLPKASPTILIPQQSCNRRGHNYQDPRPELTNKQYGEV